MQQIWYLSPGGPLADAVALHLDRAGISFALDTGAEPPPEYSRTVFLCGSEQDARQIAQRIIEEEGKTFVPETPGECLEKAVRLGLFPPDTDWNSALTRAEAAVLMIRLLNILNML